MDDLSTMTGLEQLHAAFDDPAHHPGISTLLGIRVDELAVGPVSRRP